jgi:hypothetical protein
MQLPIVQIVILLVMSFDWFVCFAFLLECMWIEVPLNSFPISFGPKPHKMFCGSFCYYRMTEWCSSSLLLGPRGENITFFVHFHVLTNWIAISHSVPSIDVAHVPTVVCNSDRFLSFPMFIMSCPLLIVYTYLSICACLSCLSKLLLLGYLSP